MGSRGRLMGLRGMLKAFFVVTRIVLRGCFCVKLCCFCVKLCCIHVRLFRHRNTSLGSHAPHRSYDTAPSRVIHVR
jgi:hypothetical protein